MSILRNAHVAVSNLGVKGPPVGSEGRGAQTQGDRSHGTIFVPEGLILLPAHYKG